MAKIRFRLNTQMVVLLAVVVLWIALGVANASFRTMDNVHNIMLQMAIQGVIGIGAVVIILTGGIDLSVGSVVGFTNIFLAMMLTTTAPLFGGLPIAVAVGLALLVAALAGLVNGVLVFEFKLPPFIATLGMMTVLRGGTLLLTGGKNVFGLPRSISNFANSSIGPFPYLFLVLIVVLVVTEVMLRYTTFGRYSYALGSNPEAARLCGVNTRLVTYGVYAFGGLLGGIAGSMETSRLWMGVPTTGNGAELDAIAAAVLGGASLMGAEGNAVGAFIGALLMATIYNGAVLLGVDANFTKIIVGAILIVTVAVDQFRKHRGGS